MKFATKKSTGEIIPDKKMNDFFNGSIDHDTNNINENVNINNNTNTLEVEKKVKFTDIHKNEAFWIRKDIVLELNKLSKKGAKGFKNKFINDAIREHLERYGISIKEGN